MPRCPACQSTQVVRNRWIIRATKPRIMRWHCKSCGKYFQSGLH